MYFSSSSFRLTEIQQLVHALLLRAVITVHQVMSFLAKTIFCAYHLAKFCSLCCVIHSDMLNVYHSPAHIFLVITTYSMPHHWAFCFQGSWYPLSCCGTWSGSMCKLPIVLQEFQVVALMWQKMAFRLSDGSFFLSILGCYILNLAAKHGNAPIPVYIPTKLCGRQLSLSRKVGSRVALASLHSSGCLSSLVVSLRWICWQPHVSINVNCTIPWKIHYMWES